MTRLAVRVYNGAEMSDVQPLKRESEELIKKLQDAIETARRLNEENSEITQQIEDIIDRIKQRSEAAK